jgi:heavy metal translocating P-type ATPase
MAVSKSNVTAGLAGLARLFARYLALVPAAALIAGGVLWWLGHSHAAQMMCAAGTVPVLLVLVATSAISLWKGEVGLDIVAAIAMTGALVGGEYLAGVVVALMFSGGQSLESFAQGSAEREMTALLGRVARTAQRRHGERIETVPIELIAPGDRLLIRAGEALPVDGIVRGAIAILDESALTGEAMPVRHAPGSPAASGITNVGDAFDLEVVRAAADSTYAGVVRLVEAARQSRAPMSRLADRYAMGFLAVTLALSGGAWLVSGDWHRALAVLVVATPCPLILAVPVAIVSGMSRCARRGVLVKAAGTLEVLARVKTLLIDKTGTLTSGRARLTAVEPVEAACPPDLLKLAGSLAQASQHVMSEAIAEAAVTKGCQLEAPAEILEAPGEGLSGRVGDRRIVLGQPAYVARETSKAPVHDRSRKVGSSVVAVGVDGVYAADLVFEDAVRPEALSTLLAFRDRGIDRIVIVTGDRAEVAEAVAIGLPIDLVVSNTTPAGKVEAVRAEAANGPTLMVGDGINDAPALALADVGVALGARGAAAAAEAADVVVLVDRLDRIAEAIGIARRTRSIALQSVYAGIGLSGFGMVAAAAGYLPPLAGALAQEVIDVAVILNALRCLSGPATTDPRAPSPAPPAVAADEFRRAQDLARSRPARR